jgi:hypothetical protein
VELRFATPIETGPGAHPASYTNGTVSVPVVKWPGYGVDNPSPSSAKVKARLELHTYSATRALWPVLGEFYLYLNPLVPELHAQWELQATVI